jgi:hypothetical protein
MQRTILLLQPTCLTRSLISRKPTYNSRNEEGPMLYFFIRLR